MRTHHVLVLAVAVLGCSEKSGDRVGFSSSLPGLPGDLTPVFDDLGAAIAADLERATKTPPKSRVGGLEVLVGATPAGIARHRAVLDKHGVTVESLLEADGNAVVYQIDRITVKLEGPMKEYMAVIATLPDVDDGDCRALARRVVELREAGSPEDAMVTPLMPGMTRCASVLTKEFTACFDAASASPELASFDACVAKAPGPAGPK